MPIKENQNHVLSTPAGGLRRSSSMANIHVAAFGHSAQLGATTSRTASQFQTNQQKVRFQDAACASRKSQNMIQRLGGSDVTAGLANTIIRYDYKRIQHSLANAQHALSGINNAHLLMVNAYKYKSNEDELLLSHERAKNKAGEKKIEQQYKCLQLLRDDPAMKKSYVKYHTNPEKGISDSRWKMIGWGLFGIFVGISTCGIGVIYAAKKIANHWDAYYDCKKMLLAKKQLGETAASVTAVNNWDAYYDYKKMLLAEKQLDKTAPSVTA